MVLIKRVIGLRRVPAAALTPRCASGIVYFHDQQFKDAIRELALFAGRSRNTDEVAEERDHGSSPGEHQIPLDPDFVEIARQSIPGPRREGHHQVSPTR